MAITLKKIGDIQTLSLGYTHEGSAEASAFSASTGAQALAFNVAGAGLAGTVGKCAVIVDELVTAAVTDGGAAISDATLAVGDDGDANGMVVEADVFSDSGNAGKIFANNGAITQAGNHLVTQLSVTSNGTGSGLGDAAKGKFRFLVEYYPTAGQGFSN
tara:strand:+ start:34 stop:510 length:477 start_codon:yes stop_codon:yes gene_type:complete